MIEKLYSLYLRCGGRVTTDSRSIAGGELFFALKGENFDGNAFAPAALEAGAAAAVVSADAQLPDDPRYFRVEDTFTALRDLAVHHRLNVAGPGKRLPVIGLTGTNGKTTTKELIAAVLATKYRVAATRGNFNNDIGVPLSLLGITPETEIAVIEMGANHPDDIAKLVRVSQPDYGLITNVGKAHLLGFGSFEGVKAAKRELYRWLGDLDGGRIFINEDDPDLKEMSRGIPCHFFGYGLNYQGAEILPTDAGHPFLRIMLDGREVATQLVGSYNAANVLAAIAVGDFFGVSREAAAAAIAAYLPRNKRSQMEVAGSNVLIVDAYNANPSSMAVAIDNLSVFQASEKIALLGDMRELGDDSVAEHRKVLEHLRSCSLKAYLVGEEFRKALAEEGSDVCLGWFPSSDDLAAHLAGISFEGTAFLVKGSRGIQMEKVLPALSQAGLNN